MAGLYGKGDAARVVENGGDKEPEAFRSEWRRDYARLIHSPSFRRLQGKTQVFPGQESDFYRNRLSHSLEVAQIAKSIAIRLNAKSAHFKAKGLKIEPDIVEFAGMAHDLGHPPFGHNGEEALDECMHGFGGFEGNAQTLRIVSKLEKKTTIDGSEPFGPAHVDRRCGLNLTYRSLAALLKYDHIIPVLHEDRPKPGVMKGYYEEDKDLVADIKRRVLGGEFVDEFKTVECSIMDIADDIAYSTYDLEDNFKAGFLTPMGLLALEKETFEAVAKTIRGRIEKQYPEKLGFVVDGDLVANTLSGIFADVLFKPNEESDPILQDPDVDLAAKRFLIGAEVQALSRKLASDGYRRVAFTSKLVQQFLSGVEVVPHPTHPQLHKVRLEFDTFINVEVLKNVTYHCVIKSPAMQIVEHRGKDIVKAIFDALKADGENGSEGGTRLMPDDFRAACLGAPKMQKMRTICDFIAGMTDRYAFEFYGRLHGSTYLTVHKPY